MILGLISDTHDNLPLCEQAVAFFRERRPDLVVHLGDITTPGTVRLFEGLPVQFVCGNNDVSPALGAAMQQGGFPTMLPTWTARLEGVRVGAAHGHQVARLRQLRARSDVVLHGHTHRRRCVEDGGALMVNPGALYRVQTRTLALMELPSKRVAFFEVREDGVRPLGN